MIKIFKGKYSGYLYIQPYHGNQKAKMFIEYFLNGSSHLFGLINDD